MGHPYGPASGPGLMLTGTSPTACPLPCSIGVGGEPLASVKMQPGNKREWGWAGGLRRGNERGGALLEMRCGCARG
jgi:hypothetical protein